MTKIMTDTWTKPIYDENGILARSGNIDKKILKEMIENFYEKEKTFKNYKKNSYLRI